ncbi:hypothetical protein AOQ84DRAFT_380734 [Glonium stellatum]|uniref:Uncharacterized protein n=1 Tax=Glonium stellatum TaxID=574774 RepID=A0A8E2ET00_9PEZI|nr:hypothetical protein AOQ84DRAFT_380734 [Glonium stellatum]
MTTLYNTRWWSSLNPTVIKLLSNSVEHPRFPAVAFLRRVSHSATVLQIDPLKCYFRQWIEYAPLCSGMTVEEALDAPSCDCSDGWPTLEDLEASRDKIMFNGYNTPYIALTLIKSTVSRGAGHFLQIQVFFTCEFWLEFSRVYDDLLIALYEKGSTTEARASASVTPAPGV